MSAAISFVLVFIVYSHIDLYLRAARIIDFVPGFWSAFVAVLALLSWLFPARSGKSDGHYSAKRHRKNQRALAAWAAVFGCLAAFSFLFSDPAPGLLISLFTLASTLWMLGLYLVIFRGEREIKAGRVALVLVVLMSVINNVIDLSGLYSFSDTDVRGPGFYINPDGRGAGFYVNPNVSGIYLVLGMVLSVAVVPAKHRLKYCLIVGVGVVATFSRGSILAWVAALCGVAYTQYFRMDRRLVLALLAGVGTLLLAMQFSGALIQAFGLEALLSENALERLHYDAKEDKSVRSRLDVAERSVALIERAPWVGHGLGSASAGRTAVNPHNMFLLVGVEMGLVGLVVYCCLYLVLWRFGADISKVFVAGFFIGSLFSHDLLDNSSMWLAFALLCGVVSPKGGPGGREGPADFRVGQGRFQRVASEPWRVAFSQGFRL